MSLLLGAAHWLISKKKWGLIQISPFDPEKRERSHDFKISRLSRFQRVLLKHSLQVLDEFNNLRQERAAHLEARIREIEGVDLLRTVEGSEPVPMMVPIFFEDVERMHAAYKVLRKKRLGPSRMYKTMLKQSLRDDFDNPDDGFSRADWMANRLLTLPCHPFLATGDLDEIVKALRSS